jgi:hypothetical protein
LTTELLTIDVFRDKIGQPFVLEEADTPPIEVTLVDATELRNYANAPRTPFSLLFTTKGDFVLPQRMYPLKHAALGLQTIFLVPVDRSGEITTYQAVFN